MARIKDAFLDGMNDVFSILFNTEVLYYPMDDDETMPDDVYRETDDKRYKDPIGLIGKVLSHFSKEDNPDMTIGIDAVITVPTKQLIINNLPKDTVEDLRKLARGKMKYKQVETYYIEVVRPKTLVDDEWQFYDFYCYMPKKVKR